MITQDESELLIGRAPHSEPTVFQDFSRSIKGKGSRDKVPMERRPRLIKVGPMTGQIEFDLGDQFSHTPLRLLAQSEQQPLCVLFLYFLPHHPPARAVRYNFSHVGHLNRCPSPL